MTWVRTAVLLGNGRVHPAADEPDFVDALLVADGKVLAAGAEAQIASSWSGRIERIDLAGRTVLPGLCDSHIHLEKYARSIAMIDCETDKATLLDRVRRRAAETPPGAWVLGHGWNQNDWGGHGTASELDAVAPDHPVYLTAKSLHAAWANSLALRIAGLDRNTPEPDGGSILRTPSGDPTGILLEGAIPLVADQVPQPDLATVLREIGAAQQALWRFGITAVHDFDGARCFRALQAMRADGSLGLRVLKSVPIETLDAAERLGLQSGFGDDLLRIGHVKIFADGALGPRTAAMLEPFDGEPDNRGVSLVDRERLLEIGIQAAHAGLPLAVHAIGDRANHEVLEGLAALREYEAANHLPGLPHRIEHLQLLHPDDLARPASLAITASMQPIHATSDRRMADRYWGLRSRYAYAWREMLDRGARLVFGSDAPVESPNPFFGVHAAVTRRGPDGEPGPQGWIPEQRIALAEALRAYTSAPSALAGTTSTLGVLHPGFHADLIVLDEDPYQLPGDRLATIAPWATMVAGKWVYRSEAASA